MTDKLKVGVIGLGVGEAHIEGYKAHPKTEVTHICDFSEKRLTEIGLKNKGIALVSNADEVLHNSEIDVVSICSYDSFHCNQIVTALNNGKHVFVEKPLCLSEQEAILIANTLQKHPSLKLSSNLILRQSERFIQLKKELLEGGYGDVFYVKGSYNYGRLHKIIDGWRSKESFYSIVYGGGVHILDLILWLTEQRVVEVFAYGNNLMSKNSGFSNFDMVTASLKFENGLVGSIACNSACVHPHFHQLEIYGSDATFINGVDSAIKYTERDSTTTEHINTPYPGVKKGDLLYNFIDAIVENKEPKVTRKEVFDCMAVAFAIEKSAHTNKPIKVNYL